jgi:hypothetical protein
LSVARCRSGAGLLLRRRSSVSAVHDPVARLVGEAARQGRILAPPRHEILRRNTVRRAEPEAGPGLKPVAGRRLGEAPTTGAAVALGTPSMKRMPSARHWVMLAIHPDHQRTERCRSTHWSTTRTPAQAAAMADRLAQQHGWPTFRRCRDPDDDRALREGIW